MNTLVPAPNQRHRRRVERATAAVAAAGPFAAEGAFRQWYHLMPPAGWMNDPNGFIYYKGRYHLFYQHNPYAAVWGSMHWGHASSADLVHWQHHPVALAPSEPYDDSLRGGIFSGTAAVVGERLVVMYTAALMEGRFLRQRQCLAWSDDGITFEKYAGNPVIDCPPELDPRDFRDPKFWRHGDQWYCIVATRVDGDPCCALFRGDDLTRWQYAGVLARGYGRLGTMWECPDIFPLGDRHVLQFSPMGLGDQKTAALVGEMDYAGCRFSWSKMGEVDAGFDFYGPQSTAGPDGQRVVVGWQNAWDWMPWFSGFGPAAMENWCGCMSLPRAVSLGADGTPRYWPVAGLESLRGEACDFGEQTLSAGERFPLLVGDNIHFELELTVDLGRTRASLVELRLRESAHEETLVRIDLALGALSVDRSRSDLSLKGVITRPLAARRGGADSLTLRLFADTSSVEVFADEGRVCMDCAIFPERSSTGLSVQAVDGTAVFSARGWAMRPAASSLAWE